MSFVNCPNCNAQIKGGLFNSNKLLKDIDILIINEANNTNKDAYCDKCGFHLIGPSSLIFAEKISKLKEDIVNSLSEMLTTSIESPYNWNYKVLGLVTSQSVTGTGVFSEISMTINDMFGSESNSMNKKIKDAEQLCLARLKKSAREVGGNAIVGLDIDYSEVGSLRGMMMVCCTGTAVVVENTDVFSDKVNDALKSVDYDTAELTRLIEIHNKCVQSQHLA
jgi:uncharacterized protein YbjQ (UPF0145 family)